MALLQGTPSLDQILVTCVDAPVAAAFTAAGFVVDTRGVQHVKSMPIAQGRTVCFVSPGNSLGFMDSGIDLQYTGMFPGIQERLQGAMVAETTLGRKHIPVGQSLALSLLGGDLFVAAPTMLLPQDVSRSRNAYHAARAALAAFSHTDVTALLVLPAMCCGCGKMAPEEAAAQMRQAVEDARAGAPRVAPEVVMGEQPDTYMNSEFVGRMTSSGQFTKGRKPGDDGIGKSPPGGK